MRLQELLGRVVVDASGERMGRVVDVVAEPRGDDLCITTLVIGAGGWPGRLGLTARKRGRIVRWEQIAALEPQIRLRPNEEAVDAKG